VQQWSVIGQSLAGHWPFFAAVRLLFSLLNADFHAVEQNRIEELVAAK
jgi:hypothetical protein